MPGGAAFNSCAAEGSRRNDFDCGEVAVFSGKVPREELCN